VSARKIEIEREREREREREKKRRRIREDLGLFVVGGVCFLAVHYYYFIFGVKNKRMRNSYT
jgi:hypothetical protein